MVVRTGARIILSVAAIALSACPTPVTLPDASEYVFDGGNPAPKDACSGGCSAGQICNLARRTCEDACGGCDGGSCVKVSANVYTCRETVSSCGGNICQPGEVSCVSGACACISSANGSDDSCSRASAWCHGNQCKSPARFEECNPDGLSCDTGYVCSPVLSETMNTCVKDCSLNANACDRGDVCNGGTCLPQGLFQNQECNQHKVGLDGGLVRGVDGGLERVTVEAGNTCLLKSQTGLITDPDGKGTGNCTYAFFRFWSFGNYTIDTCRPPGQATAGQACKADYSNGTQATQCSTGLECVSTNPDGTGVCMRMCNANPPRPGFVPQPACGTGEACVNVYRYSDPNDNAVLGVCMKSCNVFDAASSTCADIGTTHASCVPSTPDGTAIVSTEGSGICAPHQKTVSPVGQVCAETDPFHGASCATGQLCSAAFDPASPPKCEQTCDLTCVGVSTVGDAGASVRCATQPNATCASGKTCQKISSTSNARVGFCR